MYQGSTPQSKPQKIALYGYTLFLVGLSFVSAVTLSSQQQSAKALEVEVTQVATSNSWSGSSFPVENFQAYTSAYGYRRSASGGSGTEFHRGLDMAAPQGSYIRNWWVGKVIEVGDRSACGTHVVIQSSNWQHTYCHMQGHVEIVNGVRYLIDREGGIQLRQGQIVKAGTRLGRVGMTGRTTGPHLHWGLKYANEYIDPAVVLRAMYAQQTGGRYSVARSGTVAVPSQQSAVVIEESQTIRDFGY